MISLTEAQAFTFSRLRSLPEVEIEAASAVGYYLAGPVVAVTDVPPFANTAVDGYALRFEEAANPPTRLHLAGEIAAGATSQGVELAPGSTVRVLTGAPLPAGTSAVVMVEDTRLDGDTVLVTKTLREGENIRDAGSDIVQGASLFRAGTKITPAILGVLTSIGVKKVAVFGKPRVGVISTGDELSDESQLAPGKIYDSNRPTLLGLVAEAGAIPVDLGRIRDDKALLSAAFSQAAKDLDAVITTGGVSVGDYDYTKVVLEELSGGSMRWMQVAIKPAKPYAFGYIGGTPLFGLPGNPVSSVVSFELFVRPALLMLQGASVVKRPVVLATATTAFRRHQDGKLHFNRALASATSEGELKVGAVGIQGSHVLSGLAGSNCLALIPDGEGAAVGDRIKVMLTGEIRGDQ